MIDRFNRNISYLRISVTDRCNLRCLYCMPEKGVELMNHDEILSFEEITAVVKTGVNLGIRKVRITGGEPLVRKGIVKLIEMLSAVEGIEEVSMTSNGILLDHYAKELAKAGLKRINISLDTMDPAKFLRLTKGGDINSVFRGIEAAEEAGISPIKINCVVWNSSDEPDAENVAQFARNKGLKIQFIHQMDLSTGQFSRVEGGNGGDCSSCNRLRLTANGMLKPCLFNKKGFSVREYGIAEAFRMAVQQKPKTGTKNRSGRFYNIGG